MSRDSERQRGLFDPPPVVHRNDPETSFEAERVHRAARKAQRERIYGLLLEMPGSTASELAECLSGSPWAEDPHEKLYQVRRRLSDLRHGKPARAAIVGKNEVAVGRRESRWLALS